MSDERSIESPSYTQVPNALLDVLMPAITTLAELKITLAIARETFGWHREEELLSLDQLQELTGLSRQSAQSGVTAALGRGYVYRHRQGHGFVYGLRVKDLGSNGATEESSSLTQLSQASRPGSTTRKETPTGVKEKTGSESPPKAKKGDKPGRRIGGKVVTDAEADLAAAIVEAFNDAAGTRFTLTPHLTPIVGRLREHPELDAAEHREIIAANFRDPWWDGRPGLQVIYGNAAQFERAMEARRTSQPSGEPSPYDAKVEVVEV